MKKKVLQVIIIMIIILNKKRYSIQKNKRKKIETLIKSDNICKNADHKEREDRGTLRLRL